MITVLCAGAHGSDIALDALCKRQGVRYYDDDIAKGHQPIYLFPGGEAIVGINDVNQRLKIAARTKAQNPHGWVHDTAWVAASEWGEHTHINAGCIVIRAKIGSFCNLAPRVTVCGDVTIGDFVTIGAGATISNLVTIGNASVIGAGAVIPPNTTIPSGETWVGVPGRPV